MRRVSRMPTCGAMSSISAASKPGTSARRKRKYSTIWRRPSSLGRAELARVGGVHGAAVGVAQLRDIGAPDGGVALRAQDGAAAREVGSAPDRACLVHQRVDGLELADRRLRTRRIDMADAEHRASGTARRRRRRPARRARRQNARRRRRPRQSMNSRARTPRRPDLVSTTQRRRCARRRRITTPAAQAWNSSCTPAASSNWSAAHL